MRNVKESLTLAILLNSLDSGGPVIAVRRPESPDDPFGGMWGLPAVSKRRGEFTHDAFDKTAGKAGH